MAGNFSSYGTMGMSGDGSVPGGRTEPVSWKDQKGNFWIFGGAGFDSAGNTEYLNDLWEYNPSIGEWA